MKTEHPPASALPNNRCQGLELRSRRSPALILHTALWGGLFALFLCFSAPQMAREIRAGSCGPVDSLHSFDVDFWGVKNMADSKRLLRLLSLLSEDRPVLIFMSGDDRSAFLGMALACLVWPRPVQMVFCSEPAAEKRLAAIKPSSVGAVIFCKMKGPAWFPAGVRCGRDVTLVALRDPRSRQ